MSFLVSTPSSLEPPRRLGRPCRYPFHRVSHPARIGAFVNGMKATVMFAAGDVRIQDVPDPSIIEPTDAIVRVTSACICGSDLWPYADMERSETGQSMGHEAIGVVEEVGVEVQTIKRGDLVVMPFAYSDGTCDFCREGLQTACVHVGFFGSNGVNGAQAE